MTKTIHFEQSISELEEIVKQLEKGELSLDNSLTQFEKGISLAKRCQEVLQQAEQKIELLTNKQSSSDLEGEEPASD